MSERLTLLDVFGGVLTNSEIHHFGGAHTGTEVAYCGEPIDKLFEIENMCYDKIGREIISLDRLRELAEAEKHGRVVVLPDCKKCKNYAARDALYPQCIGVAYPCEGCVGLIKIKRYPNNKFEPESALSSVINQVDRCSTCDNNGKPICSSCIMTGHGNDIDFYRVATESKGEATT